MIRQVEVVVGDVAHRRPQHRQRLLPTCRITTTSSIRTSRCQGADCEDGAPGFRRLLEFPPRDRARDTILNPTTRPLQFVVPQAGDAALLERLRSAGQGLSASRRRSSTSACDLRFVTDFPNQGEASRHVFNAIVEELGRAKHEAVVESPVPLRDQERRLCRARRPAQEGRGCPRADQQPGIHRRLETRSGALYPWLGSLADTGLTLSAYGGAPLPSQGTSLRGGTPRWGCTFQARRHRRRNDPARQRTTMDPRSANLNSELMLVCRGQRDLASEVLASIAAREAASDRAIERGTTAAFRLSSGALSAQPPDPVSAGDANCKPFRLPAVTVTARRGANSMLSAERVLNEWPSLLCREEKGSSYAGRSRAAESSRLRPRAHGSVGFHRKRRDLRTSGEQPGCEGLAFFFAVSRHCSRAPG